MKHYNANRPSLIARKLAVSHKDEQEFKKEILQGSIVEPVNHATLDACGVKAQYVRTSAPINPLGDLLANIPLSAK